MYYEYYAKLANDKKIQNVIRLKAVLSKEFSGVARFFGFLFFKFIFFHGGQTTYLDVRVGFLLDDQPFGANAYFSTNIRHDIESLEIYTCINNNIAQTVAIFERVSVQVDWMLDTVPDQPVGRGHCLAGYFLRRLDLSNMTHHPFPLAWHSGPAFE